MQYIYLLKQYILDNIGIVDLCMDVSKIYLMIESDRSMIKILIVEDEEPISDLIRMNLVKAGYSCVCAFDGNEAADIISQERFDLILLDIMLPEMDGYELLAYIKTMEIPVIFITAMGELNQRVQGLRAGADDYITKPFSITEVMARIKANIRRNTEYAAVQPEQTKLVWGPLVMNLENHTVIKSGEIIELTAKEFDILRLLLENPQRVYTKAQIYSLIWNDAYMGDENAVNVHISRLRTKIEDDPRKPQVVITVWGIGYKLGEQK